ncbi:unnamed protein product [Thlaspi arvense]|uniref:Uncharacterized protein n=1 Tax=Thlaspi arvense TaxID=13288 RepID=A0AAU9S397_THLAR|nr:unnamed protein product [Thlaspi arvense]
MRESGLLTNDSQGQHTYDTDQRVFRTTAHNFSFLLSFLLSLFCYKFLCFPILLQLTHPSSYILLFHDGLPQSRLHRSWNPRRSPARAGTGTELRVWSWRVLQPVRVLRHHQRLLRNWLPKWVLYRLQRRLGRGNRHRRLLQRDCRPSWAHLPGKGLYTRSAFLDSIGSFSAFGTIGPI